MDDWGELIIEHINDDYFWQLYDELCDDRSGFLCNRRTILQAYRDGNLYGLKVNETDEMYKRGAMQDRIFCDESFYLLPCFCVVENNIAIIIWTHSRARKMGLAKKMVELLEIKYAYKPLSNSMEFWNKCNVAVIDNLPNNKRIFW